MTLFISYASLIENKSSCSYLFKTYGARSKGARLSISVYSVAYIDNITLYQASKSNACVELLIFYGKNCCGFLVQNIVK